jgi:microcystin-dependent protein
MADWNKPVTTSTYTNFVTEIKDLALSCLKMLEGTSETNLPTTAKRYNTSSNKFESWNGSVWSALGFHTTIDSHIANSSIHFAWPVGIMVPNAVGSVPTGFLLCDGTAVSRSTYSALFAAVGTTYGTGDGSTTFNLPDMRGYLPVGLKSSQSEIDTLGKKTGSFSHTHTTPNHTHTTASHTHTMASHTHTVNGHSHVVAAHQHTVGAHHHATRGNGADIEVTGGGSHTHTMPDNTSGAGTQAAMIITNPTSNANAATNAGYSTHVHTNTYFAGRVGNVNSGVSGDAAFATGTAGSTTDSQSLTTNSPNTNTTDGSGVLTTDSGGSGTSGSANPPMIALNWIIKY